MKKFLFSLFVLSFIFFFSAVNTYAQGKGSVSFNAGGVSSMDTQLIIDFSDIFLGNNLPVEVFDIKPSGLLFGGNLRFNLFEESPLYFGGNFMLSKPKRNFVSLGGGSLGGSFPTSVSMYALDVNVGMELFMLSLERKLVPYFEVGVGVLGIRKSVTVSDFFSSFTSDAGSQADFSKHFSLGARSYFESDYGDGGFFVGGKVSFYSGAGDPMMVLGEIGITF